MKSLTNLEVTTDTNTLSVERLSLQIYTCSCNSIHWHIFGIKYYNRSTKFRVSFQAYLSKVQLFLSWYFEFTSKKKTKFCIRVQEPCGDICSVAPLWKDKRRELILARITIDINARSSASSLSLRILICPQFSVNSFRKPANCSPVTHNWRFSVQRWTLNVHRQNRHTNPKVGGHQTTVLLKCWGTRIAE